jgi:bisanhydrobacterioruberin hydratase
VKPEGIKIVLLYFLLTAGGLWHVLGWFSTLMQLLAGPILMALALLLSLEHARDPDAGAQGRSGFNLRLWGFVVGVIAISFCLEWYGVKSGKVFGPYAYGAVLQPQLLGVPIAIGFSWLAMIWSSAGVVDWIAALVTAKVGTATSGAIGKNHLQPAKMSAGVQIFLVAALMVAFDWIMEPAAVKLGYWHWREGQIPLQNYLAWFGFSLIYAAAVRRLGLLRWKLPALSRHAYFAQIIYFLLVYAS